MWVNHEKTEVYLYDCHHQKYIRIFDCYNDVLIFLARDIILHPIVRVCDNEKFKTDYLNNINMGDDYTRWTEVIYSDNISIKHHTEFRRYMFIDAYNRVIDPRIDYARVLELVGDKTYYPATFRYKLFKPLKNEKNLPLYRREPVPHTGKRKHGNYYRYPKSFREKKQNTDPSTKEFVRHARSLHNLADAWDDERPRPFPKSWKDCTKRKHQWKEKP